MTYDVDGLVEVKTQGGLTRGRRLTETQSLLCVFSTPPCAESNAAIQEHTSATFNTKETTNARMIKALSDAQDLLQYLAQTNRSNTEIPSLRNIAPGVTAHSTVNADSAVAVGHNILQSVVEKKVINHTF